MTAPQMKNLECLLSSMRDAFGSIKHSRFFESERAFQGQLLVELQKRIYLPDQAIFEQEHQKRLKGHGTNIRPDIIVHEPYNPKRHSSRSDGNLAVIELKLKAGVTEATADFHSLAVMCDLLRYEVGIFVNIASMETHASLIPAEARGHIVSFAVSLVDGEVNVIDSRVQSEL